MFEVFVLPIAFVTLCLYLFQTITGDYSRPLLSIVFVISGLFSVYLARKYFDIRNVFKSLFLFLKSNIFAVGFISFFIVVISILISPLLFPQIVDGQFFLRFPGIADYFKHSYTITAINQFGIPPNHPYFPAIKFSYYYGYYLIPAAISKIFVIDQNSVLFFYILFTSVLSISLIYWLICQLIKNKYFRFLALIGVIFGTACDVFPALVIKQNNFIHVENWFGANPTGLIIYNPYTAFLWAPQHIFPTVLALTLGFKLVKQRVNAFTLVLTSFYIVLSSVFVGITMTWIFGIVFILKKINRKILILSGLICGTLLIPFIINLGGRSGIIFPYKISPYSFTGIFFFDLFLTLFIEYGFAPIGVAYLLLKSDFLSLKSRMYSAVGIFVPIAVTWFYRSAGPNDFSMKVMLPVVIAYNLIFWYLLSKQNNLKIKIALGFLALISIVSGMGGAGFEYYYRWKTRLVLSSQESNLMYSIRKIDTSTTLAAINREEWVYHLPVMGYRSVFSPSLYDAGVYAGQLNSEEISYSYESKGGNLFTSPTQGNDIKEVVSRRNEFFKEIGNYFYAYKFDYLILPKNEWVKEGENFWFNLMTKIGVDNKQLSGQYSLFDRNSIIQKFKENSVTVDTSKKVEVNKEDKKFELVEGLWFVTACFNPGNKNSRVEFDEYFSLFDVQTKDYIHCAGQIFSISSKKTITISSSTNVDKIVIYPISIQQTKGL